MYWSNYVEEINFNSGTGKYDLYGCYAVKGQETERTTTVDKASDAPAVFLQWRNEFKSSLKPITKEQAAA